MHCEEFVCFLFSLDIHSIKKLKLFINPFYGTGLFLYPLKTSENKTIFCKIACNVNVLVDLVGFSRENFCQRTSNIAKNIKIFRRNPNLKKNLGCSLICPYVVSVLPNTNFL